MRLTSALALLACADSLVLPGRVHPRRLRSVDPSLALRAAPPLALALPSCSASQAPVGALASGAFAACSQAVISYRLGRSSDPAVSSTAGYRAHHAVAFAYMIFATAVGCGVWLGSAAWLGDAASRLLVPAASSGTVRFLAAAILGELVIWDLPTAIWVKQLRRVDMLIHHVAMAVVAALVVRCPIFYGAFYLGVVELSVLPLTLNELFAAAHDANEEAGAPPPGRVERLAKWRDLSQVVAAAAFVLVRGVEFTRVTATKFVPEVLGVLRAAAGSLPGVPDIPVLRAFVGFTVGFNALQLYWLALLVAYTAKQGLGGKRPD